MDKILNPSYFKTFNYFFHIFSQITTDFFCGSPREKIRDNRRKSVDKTPSKLKIFLGIVV
jgi:hypothetical protein